MNTDLRQWGAKSLLVLMVLVTNLSVSLLAEASIPNQYTNDNFWTSTHDQPVSFSRDVNGNFSGITKTGKKFEQRIIENTLSVRLQRFSIDQAFFYISDQGIIQADNDTMALSIYLMRIS
jgi:hypothetical protein